MAKSERTLVIFDVDETLVYSERFDSQSFADTYQFLYKMPFPGIDWYQYPHVTDTTIFGTVLQKHFQRIPTHEERERFEAHYVGLLQNNRLQRPDEFKEIPFAKQMIDKLMADRRFIVSIGTGGWLKPAMIKLKHVGIPGDRLYFGAADGHDTRDGIISHLIEQVRESHQDIDRIVYVGDALWDIETTRQLGLNFIGIRRRGDKEFLSSRGADLVFQDYSNYDAFVNAIFKATPPKPIAKCWATHENRQQNK